MTLVQEKLGIHEARLRLYHHQQMRVPIFVVAEFHAAVFNLRRDVTFQLDPLDVWFSEQVQSYLEKIPRSTCPKQQYLNLPQHWRSFQQYMRVYYIAFRTTCYRDPDVRSVAERLFKKNFNIHEETVSEHLHCRTVHQKNVTSQLLRVVFHDKRLNTDVWSNIASFVHPLYIIRSCPSSSKIKSGRRPKKCRKLDR